MTFSDQPARDLIAKALDVTLVVEAAAGTGKTTEIVNRIVEVLATGRGTADSIVAVTFTVKAAGELKLRLRSSLQANWQSATGERRKLLEESLRHLEQARVNTMHGFCADLLREWPVEAGVDPAFATMNDAETAQLFRTTFQTWVQTRLEDPPEGLRRIMRRVGRTGIIDDLRHSAFALTPWRDYSAPWQREPFPREAMIDALVERLRAFAALTERCGDSWDTLYRGTQAARQLAREITQAEQVESRDYDGLEAALISLPETNWFKTAGPGEGPNYAPELPRDSVLGEHRALLDAITKFTERSDRDLAPLLQQELREVVAGNEERKRATGRIDFLDQLLCTRDLLRTFPDVRASLQRQITHIFVDEFQDTDPIQAEILLLLAGTDPAVAAWQDVTPVPGKLFIVGDPKQSIYRFRGAGVRAYLRVKDLLRNRGARIVYLTTSFRSVPAIQQVVNRSFRPLMTGQTDFQSDYVALVPSRTDCPTQPAVIALPVPEPFGKGRGSPKIAKVAVQRSLPSAIAAFIQWLLEESAWTVTERERPTERVPIAAHHICILFRNFTSRYTGDITRPYVEALDARELPHLLVGGRSLHEREEVMTLRAALNAIEYPDDELSVFATLRGSLFTTGDAELLEYRTRYGHLNMFRVPEGLPPNLALIGEALDLLRALHTSRNARPVAETIERLLEETRALASFVFRPGGEQALANVLLIADIARAFDAEGGLSFRDFVEQLEEDAAGGQAAEAPTTEEGTDGVRLMTVHKGKGLEFPVVILADPTALFTPTTVGPYVDASLGLCAMKLAGCTPRELQDNEAREREEATAENVRIAYVAATRARDILVIPVTGGGQRVPNTWLSPLDTALYPEQSGWKHPQPSPGCPAFPGRTVVLKPPVGTEHPGLHMIGDAPETVRITWWDPSVLHLTATELFGLRQEELLKEPADPSIVIQDRQRYDSWRNQRSAVLARAAQPTVRVLRATDAHAPIESDLPVTIVELASGLNLPGGPQFGSLVHAILATVNFDATPEEIDEAAALHGRIAGATQDDILTAQALATAALAHPLLTRAGAAANAGRCQRETPVTLTTPDGTLLEGVVDLAFEETMGWTVVDFKTDQDLAKGLDTYREQVRLYATAIATATGRPATAILFKL